MFCEFELLEISAHSCDSNVSLHGTICKLNLIIFIDWFLTAAYI